MFCVMCLYLPHTSWSELTLRLLMLQLAMRIVWLVEE